MKLCWRTIAKIQAFRKLWWKLCIWKCHRCGKHLMCDGQDLKCPKCQRKSKD